MNVRTWVKAAVCGRSVSVQERPICDTVLSETRISSMNGKQRNDAPCRELLQALRNPSGIVALDQRHRRVGNRRYEVHGQSGADAADNRVCRKANGIVPSKAGDSEDALPRGASFPKRSSRVRVRTVPISWGPTCRYRHRWSSGSLLFRPTTGCRSSCTTSAPMLTLLRPGDRPLLNRTPARTSEIRPAARPQRSFCSAGRTGLLSRRVRLRARRSRRLRPSPCAARG